MPDTCSDRELPYPDPEGLPSSKRRDRAPLSLKSSAAFDSPSSPPAFYGHKSEMQHPGPPCHFE